MNNFAPKSTTVAELELHCAATALTAVRILLSRTTTMYDRLENWEPRWQYFVMRRKTAIYGYCRDFVSCLSVKQPKPMAGLRAA